MESKSDNKWLLEFFDGAREIAKTINKSKSYLGKL